MERSDRKFGATVIGGTDLWTLKTPMTISLKNFIAMSDIICISFSGKPLISEGIQFNKIPKLVWSADVQISRIYMMDFVWRELLSHSNLGEDKNAIPPPDLSSGIAYNPKVKG